MLDLVETIDKKYDEIYNVFPNTVSFIFKLMDATNKISKLKRKLKDNNIIINDRAINYIRDMTKGLENLSNDFDIPKDKITLNWDKTIEMFLDKINSINNNGYLPSSIYKNSDFYEDFRIRLIDTFNKSKNHRYSYLDKMKENYRIIKTLNNPFFKYPFVKINSNDNDMDVNRNNQFRIPRNIMELSKTCEKVDEYIFDYCDCCKDIEVYDCCDTYSDYNNYSDYSDGDCYEDYTNNCNRELTSKTVNCYENNLKGKKDKKYKIYYMDEFSGINSEIYNSLIIPTNNSFDEFVIYKNEFLIEEPKTSLPNDDIDVAYCNACSMEHYSVFEFLYYSLLLPWTVNKTILEHMETDRSFHKVNYTAIDYLEKSLVLSNNFIIRIIESILCNIFEDEYIRVAYNILADKNITELNKCSMEYYKYKDSLFYKEVAEDIEDYSISKSKLVNESLRSISMAEDYVEYAKETINKLKSIEKKWLDNLEHLTLAD